MFFVFDSGRAVRSLRKTFPMVGIAFSAEKATAVAACHRHPAKSHLSIPSVEQQKETARPMVGLFLFGGDGGDLPAHSQTVHRTVCAPFRDVLFDPSHSNVKTKKDTLGVTSNKTV